MKSAVVKRSIVLSGHKTSVSLEDDFWQSLREIATKRGETLSGLVATIDRDRHFANLSSAIRLYVLGFYRGQFHRQDASFEQRESPAPSTGTPPNE
jgi:predicted DNA-binding ribbon-helix-helix protein